MNNPVEFSTAKLLKEKGFKLPCFYYYDKNGKLNEPYLENGSSTDVEFRVDLTDLIEYHNSCSTQYISAPTIAEVVMWLYENHKIWIYVDGDCRPHCWDSPTEAYEAAIKYVLENLI